MAEPLTLVKSRSCKLSPDTIKAIEKILTSGSNAKVSTGKGGVTVYEEKIKITYSQP